MKIRIDVKNKIDGREWAGHFENEFDETDAQVVARKDAWLASEIEKTKAGIGWGWAAREIPKHEMVDDLLPIFIEEFEKPLNPEDPESPTETWVRLEKEYTTTPVDLTPRDDAKKLREQRRMVGKVYRDLSNDLLDVITGHIATQNLDQSDLDQLEMDFSDVFVNLTKGRALRARPFINSITPNGTTVTQEMLDDVTEIFNEYKAMYPAIVVF